MEHYRVTVWANTPEGGHWEVGVWEGRANGWRAACDKAIARVWDPRLDCTASFTYERVR